MPVVVLCLAVYFQSAQSYSDLNADIKVTFYLCMVFIGICGKYMVLISCCCFLVLLLHCKFSTTVVFLMFLMFLHFPLRNNG